MLGTAGARLGRTQIQSIPNVLARMLRKARWVLERVGIPNREERHVQGIHRLASRPAGGGGTVTCL
jgi:hypothetical protein